VFEVDLIETPENVELERRLAGIGSRFIAGLLDTLILLGLFLILGLILLATAWSRLSDPQGLVEQVGALTLAILAALFFGLYWGYFVFFELRTNGQSPGKKAVRIRVVKDGGGAITFADVAIRNLLRVVDGTGAYAIAGVSMFISRKGQRLGDLAAGTVVVHEAADDGAASAAWKDYVEPVGEATPQVLRATGLTREEFEVLSSYWGRRHLLSLPARERLLPKLLAPVFQRAGLEMPSQSVVALEQYVADLMGKISTGPAPVPPPAPPEGPP